MAFDITQLSQSSFRGIPFYTREEDLSGGQRLTDHTFINGGTETESNGITNDIFKITGYIGGEDYLTQKEALREAFKDITSGTLIDKFYGTQTVYVEKWSIKERISAFGKADIEATFKLAKNKIVEDTDIVYTADMREDSISNFKNDFDNEIGEDLLDEVSNDIADFWDTVNGAVKFLEDTKGKSQAIKDEIGKAISNVKTSILSVDSLSTDIVNVWASFDDALGIELFGADEEKSLTNTIRETIEQSQSKTTTSIAQGAINTQLQTYINTATAGILQMAIVNLENVDFDTGDDLGSVKDDVLVSLALFEENIELDPDSPIEEIVFKQNLLDAYHLSRREFIQFYTQKYSGLQDLKDNEIVVTTDILNLTMERYNDIERVSEVLVNNDIVDPIFISGNLKLLDR